MDYIKIRFGNDFDGLGSKFENTLQEVFSTLNAGCSISERLWKPLMDIYETAEEIIIQAEIAGVKKEELELEINSKAVRIFGRRSGICCEENVTYRLAEIQYGAFDRVLYLPVPIDTNKVSASYSNGFLQIRLAKMELGQPQKIQVQIDR